MAPTEPGQIVVNHTRDDYDNWSFEVTASPDVAWVSRFWWDGAVSDDLEIDGDLFTIKASNGTYTYRRTGVYDAFMDAYEVRRVIKCDRCGNYPSICGHGLPFKDRIKSIGVQTLWASSSH